VVREGLSEAMTNELKNASIDKSQPAKIRSCPAQISFRGKGGDSEKIYQMRLRK
jgi:hypothetical protein